MNFIAGIILAAIVVDFMLHGLADFLNLKMLQDELPEAFHGFYDKDLYRKSQEYLRVNTKFGWITSTFNISAILIFWFGKGFPLLDQWVRSWNLGSITTGLMYIGALLLFKALLSLPFSIYSTFVIEERFGFNKTTWPTFITDIIKVLVLSVLLGTPLLAGILIFFEYAGAGAWWYCWIAVTIFMLVVQFIAPTWIMPLFNHIYSRKNEYEADRFAVETTGNPQSMANALKKLSVNNLSNLTPHPLYVFLNYSHPPVLDRLKIILGTRKTSGTKRAERGTAGV